MKVRPVVAIIDHVRLRVEKCSRFILYGVYVSLWGSGTLKIVIPFENYPQKRSFRLPNYHPLSEGIGVLISGYQYNDRWVCPPRLLGVRVYTSIIP